MDVNESFDSTNLAQISAESDKAAAVARRVEADQLNGNGRGKTSGLAMVRQGDIPFGVPHDIMPNRSGSTGHT